MKSSLFIRSLSNIIFICPYKFENLGCLNLLIQFINDLQTFASKIVSTGVFKILSLHNLADEFKTSDRILSLCYFSTVLKTILISNDFLHHCFKYLCCFVLDGVQMFSDVMIISFSFMMQPSSITFSTSSTLLPSLLSLTVSICSLIVAIVSS